MRTVGALVIACLGACLTACSDASGSLDLKLSLPSQDDLRPQGATEVTITATLPGESPISVTSQIDHNAFSAGDLPVGDDVQVGVVLRDVSNRIVGIGEASETVDIKGDKAATLSIPVRRPFVYATDGTMSAGLTSYDPTLDARDDSFQGTLSGVSNSQFMLSVGGDRLAIVTKTQVLIVTTATNTVSGMITIPSAPKDAASVPGTHKIAIASASGITIVDIDSSTVSTAAVGDVDRVTAGPDSVGHMFAYGLIGRVIAPALPPPLGVCMGTSQLVAIDVDNPATVAPKSLNTAVSDLAASPDSPMLFASLPCSGQVAHLEGDATNEVGTLTLTMLTSVERAAVLAVSGGRIWAAGTKVAIPSCANSVGDLSPSNCVATSGGPTCDTDGEPTSTNNPVVWADEGASIVVSSISYDGKDVVEVVAPSRRQTILDNGDEAAQHAQVLKAITAVPLDLVTLPGGQYVSVVADSYYYIIAAYSGATPILPCLEYHTNDWLLFDFASASIAQRVRTFCGGDFKPTGSFFGPWACDTPPEAETPIMQYKPTSVGALFGAR